MIIKGRDVIAVPMLYHDEFRRDPVDSLLKYGSLPQRARAPWFTDVEVITRALTLPNQVSGPRSEERQIKGTTHKFRALVADADEYALLDGISPHFQSADDGYWHVHVDLALNKKRHGDAAGIAMGRITTEFEERTKDPIMGNYVRLIRAFEVPLSAQIIAPTGGQIYIGGITRFILQLKYGRGFNITSFSFDGFESADQMHQLAMAGLVTAGMRVDPETGMITGLPKPFSVDRQVAPYRELIEAMNERRCPLPNYTLLEYELKRLEVTEPGKPPDHPVEGSKDVADPVAGVVGYLAAFGHARLELPAQFLVDRDGVPDLPETDFVAVPEDPFGEWELGEDAAGFEIE